MSRDVDWDELIERHLRGELTESEMERLAELLDSDPSARKSLVEEVHWDTQLAEVVRDARRDAGTGQGLPGEARSGARFFAGPAVTISKQAPAYTRLRASVGIAAIIVVALAASLFLRRPGAEPHIARIVGVSGSLIWTGNSGQTDRELSVGTKLSGGTIEGLAPDSWFELEFNDGSTIMISGNSVLTFSDPGQKQLRLKEGSFSARVVPQPAGKPMQVHTPSALLEVLGTRFTVETGISSTTLSVLEGKVRVRRLSDGNTVDVQARHRVIAAPDRDMSPVREPDSVSRWKSQLRAGPEGTYGKWSPETPTHAATLRAIPFVPKENRSLTLDLLGLAVHAPNCSPVIVQPGSRFIVRGRLSSAAKIYFGIQMAHPGGEFAGKFLAGKPASETRDQSDFEAVFQIHEFDLDPCVRDQRDKLPERPEGLAVTGLWCFTHPSGSTNVEITEVELIPPTEHALE
jgi:FecR protein